MRASVSGVSNRRSSRYAARRLPNPSRPYPASPPYQRNGLAPPAELAARWKAEEDTEKAAAKAATEAVEKLAAAALGVAPKPRPVVAQKPRNGPSYGGDEGPSLGGEAPGWDGPVILNATTANFKCVLPCDAPAVVAHKLTHCLYPQVPGCRSQDGLDPRAGS